MYSGYTCSNAPDIKKARKSAHDEDESDLIPIATVRKVLGGELCSLLSHPQTARKALALWNPEAAVRKSFSCQDFECNKTQQLMRTETAKLSTECFDAKTLQDAKMEALKRKQEKSIEIKTVMKEFIAKEKVKREEIKLRQKEMEEKLQVEKDEKNDAGRSAFKEWKKALVNKMYESKLKGKLLPRKFDLCKTPAIDIISDAQSPERKKPAWVDVWSPPVIDHNVKKPKSKKKKKKLLSHQTFSRRPFL